MMQVETFKLNNTDEKGKLLQIKICEKNRNNTPWCKCQMKPI